MNGICELEIGFRFRFKHEIAATMHPCFLDHILHPLHGCVPDVACKVKEHTERGDLSASSNVSLHFGQAKNGPKTNLRVLNFANRPREFGVGQITI